MQSQSGEKGQNRGLAALALKSLDLCKRAACFKRKILGKQIILHGKPTKYCSHSVTQKKLPEANRSPAEGTTELFQVENFFVKLTQLF